MNQWRTLLRDISNQVAYITINRIESANTLNDVMARELFEAAIWASTETEAKAVVLRANGPFFCSGGDLKCMSSAGAAVQENVKETAGYLHKAVSVFTRMDQPLIVSVNGMAAGAGFSLALIGDWVIGSDSARFTMAYSKAGLSPDGGVSYTLPRIVGLRKTQILMFTNKLLSAQEAFDWGILSQVVSNDQLVSETKNIANMFAQGAAQSNRNIKRLLMSSYDNNIEKQMALEGDLISACAGSPDGQEGITAFLEKRAPKFE